MPQDEIIQTKRHRTSLKKDGERYEFYFVCEVGRDVIIGYEDAEGNDVHDTVRQLEKEGWTY